MSRSCSSRDAIMRLLGSVNEVSSDEASTAKYEGFGPAFSSKRLLCLGWGSAEGPHSLLTPGLDGRFFIRVLVDMIGAASGETWVSLAAVDLGNTATETVAKEDEICGFITETSSTRRDCI